MTSAYLSLSTSLINFFVLNFLFIDCCFHGLAYLRGMCNYVSKNTHFLRINTQFGIKYLSMFPIWLIFLSKVMSKLSGLLI